MSSQDDSRSLQAYRSAVKTELVFIILLAVLLGIVSMITFNRASQISDQEQQLQSIKSEQDSYTKRASVAEKLLGDQIKANAELVQNNHKLEMDVTISRYCRTLSGFLADGGDVVTSHKMSTLEKFVRAAIDKQKYFPDMIKPARKRMDTILSIGIIESGLNENSVGSSGELTAFQILPADIRRLVHVAEARGFSVSSNPKEPATSTTLMAIHLSEKITKAGSWEEGVREFNGNWRSNPSYWLRFLKIYHTLSAISINEKILGEGK